MQDRQQLKTGIPTKVVNHPYVRPQGPSLVALIIDDKYNHCPSPLPRRLIRAKPDDDHVKEQQLDDRRVHYSTRRTSRTRRCTATNRAWTFFAFSFGRN
jgi:hypothetical protein